MSQYKYAEIGDTVYFWFAANTTLGSAGDGATPLYDVRLAGAAAGAAATASGTPTLLTHADYPDGIHEIAVVTTAWAAGEYAVFCSLTISTVNPAGFCGSFKLRTAGAAALNANASHIGGTAQTGNDVGADVNDIKAKTDYLPSASPASLTQLATAVWQDAVLADFAATGSIGKALMPVVPIVGTVTADGANTAAAFKSSLTAYADHYFRDALILFTSSSGVVNQAKKIGDSAASGGLLTLFGTEALTAVPAGGDAFMILTK